MERTEKGKVLADLRFRPNHLDKKEMRCKAIIETPKGSRNKFDYNPEFNLFELAGLLPEGMVFPYDFGFIPSTMGEDGDPLDMLVFMDEPVSVGCLLDLRIIGVIEAEQTEKAKTQVNNRFLGVIRQSETYADIKSIKDLNPTVLKQVQEFFASYNRLKGKEFKVTACKGRPRALELIQRGIAEWKKKASAD